MMLKRLGMAVAAWSSLAAMGAHAQNAPAVQCVQGADVEIVLLAYAPGAVRALRDACVLKLPAGSYLGGSSGEALVERYEDAGVPALAQSKEALARILNGKESPFGDEDIGAMIEMQVEGVLAKVDAKTCSTIDRALALADPLPPKNIIGLIVLMIEVGTSDKKGPKGLVICPAPGPAVKE
jgi:hypothetical protein